LILQDKGKSSNKVEDANKVKEKHVSFDVVGSKGESMKDEVGVKEGELGNGEVEDEDEADVVDEREENEAPASAYELPYTADEYDDDDGYDEY
jgi:hypothetical protein